MNVEVEIDWLDEDGDINSVVKQEIISKVSNQIKVGVLEKIKHKIEDRVIKTIDKRVVLESDKIVKGFLNRKYSVQDKWGDQIETGVTIKGRIKKNLEKYWNELVNRRGETLKNNYHSDELYKSRVQRYIDEKIESHSKDFAKTLTQDTENKIKASMKKNLADTIGAKLVTELGLDKLLIENKKD